MAEFVKSNDLKTAFPWYDDIRLQTRYKLGTMDCYKLITPPASLLPFVIPFKMSTLVTPVLPTQWGIYDQHGVLEVDLTAQIPVVLTGVYEPEKGPDNLYNAWVINYGNVFSNGLNLPCGFHYSTIQVQGQLFYSEVFYIPPGFNLFNEQKRYLQIWWSNSSDIMGIPYQTGFFNRLITECEVTKSAPEIIEEGVEDGNGRFFPTSQRYVDNLHFDEWGPQYIVDALTGMQMCNDVQLSIAFLSGARYVRNIKVTSTFDTPANFALIDVICQSDLGLYSGSCSDNFKLSSGSGATCNIVITNLSVSGTGNTKTFLFTPLQNGGAPINVLRYEWRSPQKNNGNWQSIDLNTTFADSFTTGQNTVCVRAICPNSVSTEVCVNFTVSLPTTQCPAGIQVYNVVYDPITADQRPVGIYYSLTGVTTNAQFIEINAPEISGDWQRFAITPSGTPQYIYYPDSTVPGEYAVQMRVVCVISGVEYLSANTNFVITLQ